MIFYGRRSGYHGGKRLDVYELGSIPSFDALSGYPLADFIERCTFEYSFGTVFLIDWQLELVCSSEYRW